MDGVSLLIHREVASCILLDPGRPYQQEPAQGGRGWPEWKGPAPCAAARRLQGQLS
jgi:hypothetical protein